MPKGLRILYEDEAILVVDKPPGLLTIGTDRQAEKTVYHAMMDYVRKGQAKSRNRVFIVHRLDQGTSGLLIFAKSEQVKEHLQSHWTESEKTYLAIVYGAVAETSGTIQSFLAETKAHEVYSTRNPGEGKAAETQYRLIKKNKVFSLVEVRLMTGRKHQIRVHMADLGHPVLGDRRYGPKDPTQKRLALHAWRLSIPHPVSGERMSFETEVPEHFERLMGGTGLAS